MDRLDEDRAEQAMYCYLCGVRHPESAYPAHYATAECQEAQKSA